MDYRALVQKLGDRTNQNTQTSELILEHRTGHPIYLLALLLAFIFSGLGLVISNYNETMQQAVFVMWFIAVCLMLLSGLFTPVRSMPHWAYLTTYVNPMHYFIDAIRTVFVRGGDFFSIIHQLLALAIIAVLMNVWAMVSYRKNS